MHRRPRGSVARLRHLDPLALEAFPGLCQELAIALQLFHCGLPLLLPALAFGVAALLYFSLIGVELSLATLVLGHVAVCVPFVLRTTIASLAQLDPALLDASLSLGAGPFFTFRRVTLPLIGRGIAAGAFLAFMASFDNVPVSLFLSDARTEVLPIHLWQIIETDLDVRTASASGLLIVATVVLMMAAERFAGLSKQLH